VGSSGLEGGVETDTRIDSLVLELVFVHWAYGAKANIPSQVATLIVFV